MEGDSVRYAQVQGLVGSNPALFRLESEKCEEGGIMKDKCECWTAC